MTRIKLCAIAFCCFLAAALASPPLPSHRFGTCGFPGNGDLYGFGVRLGLYLQWAATIAANTFLPQEASNMRTINGCFQLALLIGLCYTTITNPDLFAAEVIIILFFGFGSTSTLQFPRNAQTQATAIGAISRWFIFSGFVVYSMWFWWVGKATMAWNPCSRSIFFLRKTDIYGWFGKFATGAMTVGAIGQIYTAYIISKQLLRDFRNRPKAEGLRSIFREFNPREREGVNWGAFVLSCILFSFFLVTVEFTILWNGVTGVGQAGSISQLIPIVVSVGGIGKIFQGLMKVYLGVAAEDHQTETPTELYSLQ